MSPATLLLCRQVIRNIRGILAACDEWLKSANGEEPSKEIK
jgi:hypothetical protein